MSGRGTPTRRTTTQRIFRRLGAVDRDRLATAVVLVGVGLAVVAVLFAGFFPIGGALASLLYPLTVLFPLFGVVIVVVALLWAKTAASARGSRSLDGERPESPAVRTKRPVSRETGWLLDKAGNEWYRCRDGESSAEVRDRLVEGTVRTLEARRGLAHGTAVETVRSGTWTDDPLAAAFLADDLRPPFDERLRAAVDPGGAFHRRVRHTLDAIDGIDQYSGRPGPGPRVENATASKEADASASEEDADERLKEAIEQHGREADR